MACIYIYIPLLEPGEVRKVTKQVDPLLDDDEPRRLAARCNLAAQLAQVALEHLRG